jgi:methylenetetrahydrofolate dehydrogenase (NADP+)/methenyltetrahydrofolate cyclohydrolase
MQIIDGKKLAEKIKDEIVQEIVKLNGQRPNLAIILVGERQDSKLYVSLKEKEAKKVGIDTHLYKCAESISQNQLLEIIKCLNEDELIDAILVQLPLPATFDTDIIIKAVTLSKDVDGFHPDNLEELLKSCEFNGLMPPVFAAVLEVLKSINCVILGKKIRIISNSQIFGQSLAHIFNCRGAKALAVRTNDKDLAVETSRADILITAVGQPGLIKKDLIKKNAVIIDIGITKQNGRVRGDVDFEDVKDKAGYLTPVPGGVGPLTIAMAFKNTLELHKRRHKYNANIAN